MPECIDSIVKINNLYEYMCIKNYKENILKKLFFENAYNFLIKNNESRDSVLIYAISDLHLSLGVATPMDVFKGWSNYVEKLKSNWIEKITENDTVVIAGDISWGMNFEESYEDFKFIDSLPGNK